MATPRYQWIVEREEELMAEQTRRIERNMVGSMCPDPKCVIKTLRRKYAPYGRKLLRDMPVPKTGEE